MLSKSYIDQALHAAGDDALEQRLLELAFEECGARSGAVFLWDPKAKALALDFHIVEGVVVRLRGAFLHQRADGRANGIAMHVFRSNAPYLCRDTTDDPHYAKYY